MIEKRVIRFVADLQPKQYKQIVSKILSLQENPRPQDCTKLERYKGGYRVDSGEYRILYTIDDKEQLVTVWRVGLRNDSRVYRGL
ncbi:type II toxin-antitoxin system RelE/ParE family toxin [Candidatus Poribacteria bacterium]|nr:type II toxin-antitoxin system RelE/ParE family toxin [Candidatus Poribacteria bacterium]